MKYTLRAMLVCALLVYSWGCVQKSAKLQKSVVPPDKTLFESGSAFLKNGQYVKARLLFQNLMMTYPDSEMAPEAHFAMGESFYEEGGTENLLQAENQFNDFIVFYPAHPKAADAQMKNIAINMKMMGTPDRDQHYAFKALQGVNKFLQQFPDSDFSPIVKKYKADVEENLALGNLGVGKFYEDRNNILGARGRYKEILDNYPDFSDLSEVLFRIASILDKIKNTDEEAIYLGKIVSEHPFSKRSEEAKAKLKAIGKPVPDVNEKLAAANQAKVRQPEGFSPLKPFIDFGKALGFVSEPDRYEEAKKTIEAEKVKAAEAAAKEVSPQKPSDDILIESEIRKSASGETKDTTVLTNNSGTASQSDADKKKEEQKAKKRYTKKNS
jgi:outer membrane assembly lipoprotein YfiO